MKIKPLFEKGKKKYYEGKNIVKTNLKGVEFGVKGKKKKYKRTKFDKRLGKLKYELDKGFGFR